jgi:hypothetical protein
MVWEFPAVSQSRKEFWAKPQYTKSGMWWFTLVFGFFGLHHFLLRSPQTGLIFLLANIISLGYLWFYDLIQLSGEEKGGVSQESLDKHGLSWGFGALGLAKGMWVSGNAEQTEAEAGAEADAPPNPFYFLAYALLIPIAPLAQLIAGDTYNSVSRFLDLTIIPGGFLFYLGAMIYDYIIMFLYPGDLFVFGSKRFFPFTFLGMDPDNHSPNITAKVDYAPCPPDNMFLSMLKIIIALAKQVPFISSAATSIETALATAQVVKTRVIDQGLAKVQQGVRVATQVGQLASSLPAAAASAGVAASSLAASAVVPSLPVSLAQRAQGAQGAQGGQGAQGAQGAQGGQGAQGAQGAQGGQGAQGAQGFQKPPVRGTMVGGAIKSYNSLEYLTLGSLAALIGGGLLVGINRGLQNYTYTGKDDSPPNAGRV